MIVEKFADFIFKVHNLGVPDLQKEITQFSKSLFDLKKAFDLMNENEFV